jgi:hypothetical protein
MKTVFGTTLVLIVVSWVFLWPFAVIWALNTLFAMSIAYTFWNWLAMAILVTFFGASSVKMNKD